MEIGYNTSPCAQIYNYVMDNPGSKPKDIKENLNLGGNTTYMQLLKLKSAGVLFENNGFFPRPIRKRNVDIDEHNERNPDVKILLTFTNVYPGITVEELAGKVDKHPATVLRVATRLSNNGLLALVMGRGKHQSECYPRVIPA